MNKKIFGFDWFVNSETPRKSHAMALNTKKGYVTTLCGDVILYPEGFTHRKFLCAKCVRVAKKSKKCAVP